VISPDLRCNSAQKDILKLLRSSVCSVFAEWFGISPWQQVVALLSVMMLVIFLDVGKSSWSQGIVGS
jgi:hypothetical protein